MKVDFSWIVNFISFNRFFSFYGIMLECLIHGWLVMIDETKRKSRRYKNKEILCLICHFSFLQWPKGLIWLMGKFIFYCDYICHPYFFMATFF